jgi:hypothetical protein
MHLKIKKTSMIKMKKTGGKFEKGRIAFAQKIVG